MKTVGFAAALALGIAAFAAPAAAKSYLLGDTDRDGSVSLDEYIAYARADFRRIDTNRDGKASAQEARAAARKLRAERGVFRTRSTSAK